MPRELSADCRGDWRDRRNTGGSNRARNGPKRCSDWGSDSSIRERRQNDTRRSRKEPNLKTYRSTFTAPSIDVESLSHHVQAIRRDLVPLPVDDMAVDILRTIQTQRVTVIQASTGSGKSTRIPRYIAECCDGARVLCTQPRRKAATKVSQRIAEEWVSTLGDPDCRVGYYIKDDHKGDSKTLTVQFSTTGWLLQMLVHNPTYLANFTHVVLDEIHERDVDPDILFFIVRRTMMRADLAQTRLVLMSATVNVGLFTEYFNVLCADVPEPPLCLDRHVHDVTDLFLDDIGRTDDLGRVRSTRSMLDNFDFRGLPEGAFERKVESLLFSSSVTRLWAPLICGIVRQRMAHPSSPEGTTVLVFLPGLQAIETVFGELVDMLDDPSVVLYQFHSEVEFDDDVFAVPQPGKTHVILATTIAETSVTIPNVTTVIDTGVAKRPVGDPQGNIILRPTWISQSSALQRRGRTGRVCPGLCVRLYPRWFFDRVMPANPMSVIQALPLETVVLKLLMVNPGETPGQTLSQLLEAPETYRLGTALHNDWIHGFVTSEHDEQTSITPVGRVACSLALSASLCAMVVHSVASGDPALIRTVAVAATINVAGRLPFVLGSWRFDPHPEMYAAQSMRYSTIGRPPNSEPTPFMTGDVATSDVQAMCELLEAYNSGDRNDSFYARHGLKKDLFLSFLSQLRSVTSSIDRAFPPATSRGIAQVFAPLFKRGVDMQGHMFTSDHGAALLSGAMLSGLRSLQVLNATPRPVDLKPKFQEDVDKIKIGPAVRTYLQRSGMDILDFVNESPALELRLHELSCETTDAHPEILTSPGFWESAAELLLNTSYDRNRGVLRPSPQGHSIGCVIARVVQPTGSKAPRLTALLFNMADPAPPLPSRPGRYTAPLTLLTGSLTTLATLSTGVLDDRIVFPCPQHVSGFNRKTCEPGMRDFESGDSGSNNPDPETLVVPFAFRNLKELSTNGQVGVHSVLRRRAVALDSTDQYLLPLALSQSQLSERNVLRLLDAVHVLQLPQSLLTVLLAIFDPDSVHFKAYLDGAGVVTTIYIRRENGGSESFHLDTLHVDDLAQAAKITEMIDDSIERLASSRSFDPSRESMWVGEIFHLFKDISGRNPAEQAPGGKVVEFTTVRRACRVLEGPFDVEIGSVSHEFGDSWE
ncbi:Helicase conserved C-terminal domain [Carpediemonas membranifera]|uniref:Helicase conserved C-terminal domain n=1 Tax=Carpediemonas membranifera TaxID=201153 RepID=A0A8J6BZF1_9EUKA|nr:Helicase conserved C-terminal domain [Carpediemonas membranifera]|eukprot:KAG9395466.1 Helicase conserved C-terminal domain [Carpediemonas membranifera]